MHDGRGAVGARLLVVALLLGVLGCSTPPPGPSASANDETSSPSDAELIDPLADGFTILPFRRSFGPVFAAKPPAGDPQRITGAVLARDRQTLFASFTGSAAYNAGDPCTDDYRAWAGFDGDTLVVRIAAIDHPEQVKLREGQGCDLVGHGYLFRILLPGVFAGTGIRDPSLGPLWVAPPEAVAEVPLPAGWQLGLIDSVADGHVLSRNFGELRDTGCWLQLSQVFGGLPGPIGEPSIATVSIRGQQVAVSRNGNDGFVAGWRLGTDAISLMVIDPGRTLDDFVAMANAVAVPTP